MQLIRHLNHQSAEGPATALAIGNFDGLHRGHQALIRAACARADELVPALMCFEPLPATFFRPTEPVLRLLSVRDKLDLCHGYGLDVVFMPRFDAAFAALSPEAFVEQLVVAGARAAHVVIGEDFRFGARAAGDAALLERLGARHGFSVEVVAPVNDRSGRISSSRVRAALAEGRLESARELLGRAYAISGRVLRGQQLGRTLGFPTVNLRPPRPCALGGVLAVRVSGAGLDAHPGVASLGVRPTVNGRELLLEVHLFDFAGDLYGRHLSVEPAAFLRAEQRFDDVEAMTRQMHIDAERARAVLEADRAPTP